MLVEPAGRIPVTQTGVSFEVEARRPDRVNNGQPWTLHLALVCGETLRRTHRRVAVPDDRPGRVHYIITEDHELYDERESFDADLAHRTLVAKSRLAESVANEAGAAWTHMVDVGSLALTAWAAEESPTTRWAEVAAEAREHLVDAVAGGNDLGLHIHGFHDPGSRVFVHDFDRDTERVTTQPEFLEREIPERRFWSRAYPTLGGASEPESRVGATWRGIGALEALGRLGDPRFRVALFRAGSLDYGGDARERARSTAVLERVGLLADSDVPKPRLYHRLVQPTPYPISGEIYHPEPNPAAMRAVEVRAEFNIESDFLSDVRVLDAYVERRVAALRGDGAGIEPGVHIICCMTHDKFINWRMGKAWDSLDAEYGDWKGIRDHLRHCATRFPELHFSTARDAVLDWMDDHAPRLTAWRDEEIVVAAAPGTPRERFRYTLRFLGRGIAVDPAHPPTVRVLPPAWMEGREATAWIERERVRCPSRLIASDPGSLEFEVDDRDASFELVVEVEAGEGISAVRRSSGDLELRSALPYRRASVEITDERGEIHRLRGVRFDRAADDGALPYVARVDAAQGEAPE